MLDDFLALEDLIITRIRTGMPELVACGSYLTLTTLQHALLHFPSAWVGYGGYQIEGSPLANGAVQQIRQIWNVTLVVRSAADPGDGSEIRNSAGPLLAKILQLLMGWKPHDKVRSLELVPAPDPDYGDGVGMFHLSFATSISLITR